MCDLLMKSGVQAADWLVIAKQLKLTTQMLAGAFLKAWKESDYARPSWKKLAKALKAIGGGWYENASQQAEKNAGTYVCTIVSRKRAHGQSTLHVCQRGGWALF